MVNPGTFQGSQQEFMADQIEGYIKAVGEGRTTEFIADVIHQYLKRYPLRLEHNVEPSAEHLARIDDYVPDLEIVMPNKDKLSFEEYKKAQMQMVEDCRLLKFRSEVSSEHY
ncbi:uncharacterized protein ARMOST_15514 [Armillaria ostoyae]|uniref:Uncharacterized protein n=1 Tax=Armillaria ostoyae TaxID=47428 RepID=A0A284RTL2_ARMOS|nr:uncharacterized protein ARMOST_15514 [Armillaria ostoyae]